MNRLLLLPILSIYCRAEIIDRVAVVLGNEVITESEIVREIRLTSFLNGTPLDFSATAKRKTADRLVEQHLIAAEAKANAHTSLDPEELEQTLQQVRERFPSPANFKAELNRVGVTEDELKAHLARQITTLSFLDFRFRPGVQITDDEIAKYFNERVAPGLKKTPNGQQLSLDDYHSEMEEALIGERVDKAADAWLKVARARTRIEYRKEVFGDEAPKQEVTK